MNLVALPAICFSGTFTKRADNAICEHSGYICLDFDKYETDELLNTDIEKEVIETETATQDDLDTAKKIAAQIMSMAKAMDKEEEHSYVF